MNSKICGSGYFLYPVHGSQPPTHLVLWDKLGNAAERGNPDAEILDSSGAGLAFTQWCLMIIFCIWTQYFSRHYQTPTTDSG